jgi:hypothetical protein
MHTGLVIRVTFIQRSHMVGGLAYLKMEIQPESRMSCIILLEQCQNNILPYQKKSI